MKAVTTPELILPERQAAKPYMRTLGYLCRCALAFMCTYGLSVFLCDSLSLGIHVPAQLAICGMFILIFAVMGISKRFFLAGLGLGIGGLLLWLFAYGSVTKRLYTLFYAGVAVYNAWFRRLNELGYNGMMRNVLNFDYSLRQLYLTEADCRLIAYCIVMGILAALASVCILRRARIIPLLFAGASLCTLMMYFGLCTDNTGFAIMLASLCGVAALAYYDGIFGSKKQVAEVLGTIRRSRECRRELRDTMRGNSAMGGFTGIAAALIALLLLWIPSGISSGMRDIPAISHPMLRLENFVVAVINGDSPDLGGLIFSGISEIDSRDTTSQRRTYTGAKLFEIRADIQSPIYLRNWTGVDYHGDSWHTASYERIDDYRDTFGAGFSPELLTFELLEALDPALCTLPEGTSVVPHTNFGYLTTVVHVKKLTPSANVLFMPSYTDQRQRLLRYGTREQEDLEYSNYYDGIFTATSYLFLDEYSTLSNVPLLTDPDFAKNIGTLVDYFAAQYSVISILREVLAADSNEATVRRMYEQMADMPENRREYVTVSGDYTFPGGEDSLAWRYVYAMDSAARERIHALFDNLSLYYDYVYDNYLSECENFVQFGTLANNILWNAGLDARSARNFAGRHEAVMAIIDFLSQRMVYTLTPKNPSSDRNYVNAAESFLFDTGEGYCVQYATSAVMLLRSLGIPARYAEGYITSTYQPLEEGDAPGSYTSTIIDSNAHAWIEVYYDYYGWVQYEATAPYYANMYEQSYKEEASTPVSTSPTVPDYTEDPEEIIDDEIILDPDEEDADYTGAIVTLIVLVLILAAAGAVVLLLYRRGEAAAHRRASAITAARSRKLAPDARKSAAQTLDDGIFHMLAHKKLTPASGEHLSDFAARVDEAFGKFAAAEFKQVAESMRTAEFAPDVPQEALERIAGYHEELERYLLRNASFIERLWLKYFYLV